jgi:hypothetical protein
LKPDIEHLTLKLKLNIEYETGIRIQRWDNLPIRVIVPSLNPIPYNTIKNFAVATLQVT